MKDRIEVLREQYPAGTRVELVKMDDIQAPPVGTRGTVLGVDDAGSLLMKWDNGSGLNVLDGEDIVRKVMDSKVIEQILAIRDTGLTNMFDAATVQRLAFERGFYELICFIEEHPKDYVRFIITGEI